MEETDKIFKYLCVLPDEDSKKDEEPSYWEKFKSYFWSKDSELEMQVAQLMLMAVPGGTVVKATMALLVSAGVLYVKYNSSEMPFGIGYIFLKDAKNKFEFEVGHPRLEKKPIVYIQDPVSPERYLMISSFHRKLIEKKFFELVGLLADLGATKIEVRYVKGRKISGGFKVNASVSGNSETEGDDFSIKGNGYEASHIIWSAEYPGSKNPKVSEGLHWYSSEPAWQNIAKQRIYHRLKTFSLSFCYEDDFGVNGALSAGLKGKGFSFGGEFEEYISTEWSVSGTFLEMS